MIHRKYEKKIYPRKNRKIELEEWETKNKDKVDYLCEKNKQTHPTGSRANSKYKYLFRMH